MITHVMNQYDTRPYLRVQLLDGNNQPIDLSNANRVEFSMQTTTGGVGRYRYYGQYLKVEAEACTVETPTTGTVRYEFEPEDTNLPGEYRGWFTVYWDPTDDDDRQTFPGSAEERVLIYVTAGNET
jgi:hypothetical protein